MYSNPIKIFTLFLCGTLFTVSCNKGDAETPTSKGSPNINNIPMLSKADEFMHKQQPKEALKAYQEAWTKSKTDLNRSQQVWLLLSIANAAVRQGDYEESYEALAVISEVYADTGIVAGNPLFHLLVGLSYHGLNENREGAIDNFSRALICGGPAIFKGEDPVHLQEIKKILHPPSELGTWDGYEGCSRNLLNGAKGYLRDMLSKKLGVTPPYTYAD